MRRLALWLTSLFACSILLASALHIVRSTHWEHALGEPMPTEGYAVGPIRAGESAEQTFIAPGSYLAGIDVAVRPHQDSPDPVELQFRLTLVRDGQIIREGRVTVRPAPARLRQIVSWRFQLLPESAGERYAIAVIAAPNTKGHVFLPISLQDPLDGTLTTNGQATGAHNDLLLAFVRRADGGDVLRAFWHASPAIALALALMPLLALSLVCIAVAPPMQKLAQRAHIVRSRPMPHLYVLTVGLWVFAVSVAIRQFSTLRQPEANPWFWSVMVLPVLVCIEGMSVSRFGYGPLYCIGKLICCVGWMIAHGIQHTGKPIYRVGWMIAHGIQLGVAHRTQLITTSRRFLTVRHVIQTVFNASDRNFGLLSRTRNWSLALAALLVLAIAVRALAFMSHEYVPWLQLGNGTDADAHLRLVLAVIDDPDFTVGAALFTKHDTAFLVPISVALFTVLGAYRGLLAFTWIQILLIGVSCVVLAVFVSRLTRSRLAGISAGFLLALNPIGIRFSIEFMSDGIGIFFFILTFWLFFEALTKDSLRLNLAFGFSAALLLADRNTGWFAPLVAWMLFFIALKLRPFATRGQRPRPVYALRSLTPLISLLGTLSLIEFAARMAGAPLYLQAGAEGAPAVVYPAFGLDYTRHSLLDLLGVAFGVLDILMVVSLLSLASRIPFVELLSVAVLGATFVIGWISDPRAHTLVYRGLGSFSEKHLRIHVRLVRALIPAVTLAVVWQLGIHIISSDRWVNITQGFHVAGAGQQAHLDGWLWNGAVFVAALLSLVFVSSLFRLVLLAVAAYAAQSVLAYSAIFVAHSRVDLPLIIAFYIGVGIAIGACSQRLNEAARTSTFWMTRLTRRSLGLAHVSLLTWIYLATLIVVFAVGREVVIQHLEDRSYFEHLGSVVAEDSIILTSGHLDPWMVQDHVARPVVYDGSFALAQLLHSDHEFRYAYQCAEETSSVHLMLDATDCIRESANAPPNTDIVFASPSLSAEEAQVFLRSTSLRYLREATLLPIPELLSRYGQEAWVIVPARES